MKNFVLIFLVGALVVFGGFGVAWADNLVCKRITSSSSVFTSSSAFDSWFPKRLNLNEASFGRMSGKKSKIFRRYPRTYQLLPNGSLIAKYKNTGDIRYKCNIISLDEIGESAKKPDNTPSSTKAEKPSVSSAELGGADKVFSSKYANWTDYQVCKNATFLGKWSKIPNNKFIVAEAKRRGLSCGVGDALNSQTASTLASNQTSAPTLLEFRWNKYPTMRMRLDAKANSILLADSDWPNFQKLRDALGNGSSKIQYAMGYFDLTNKCKEIEPQIMYIETEGKKTFYEGIEAIEIKNVRFPDPKQDKSLTLFLRVMQGSSWVCAFIDNPTDHPRYAEFHKSLSEKSGVQIASHSNSQKFNTPTSAELEAERRKRAQLKQQLAALKAQQKQQQQTISSDTQIPLITITQSGADGRKGIIKGFAQDNVQVAEVLINGEVVNVAKDGSFEWSGFVPASGKDINIEAIDTAALSSTQVIRLERGQIQQASGPRFDDLDPTSGRQVVQNDNALALIVGISDYERTDAPAIYADKDAEYFHDYASLKLGIPDSNITTMVNDKAEQGDVILAVKDWMRRLSKPGKTDVYVFFAGHGLASDDGEQMYLLPFDGRPRLLDKTAILREELFNDIASANPRSVTVFLDTCYSGTTRGTDMLIASRPIALKALKQSLPDNFTVLTAAAGDQTAKPLEEAKHGMFSYFLMKGMEGDADANQDNQITAGELHQYVQSNVVQQSSGSQTPELQGDAERVLVQFQ